MVAKLNKEIRSPLSHDLHLVGFDRQGHAAFGTHDQTFMDCVANILNGLVARLPLAYATGNGRALDNPHAIFVAVESN